MLKPPSPSGPRSNIKGTCNVVGRINEPTGGLKTNNGLTTSYPVLGFIYLVESW